MATDADMKMMEAPIAAQKGKAQGSTTTTAKCSSGVADGCLQPNNDGSNVVNAPATGRKRTIGGKNTKWAVSTQRPKKLMSACYICAQPFQPDEPRLQQWGDRNSCQRYVHGHCVHGGISIKHEFVPKDGEDTGTVGMLKPKIQHNEAEVHRAVLPFADDQASTTVPSTQANSDADPADFQEERESRVKMEFDFIDVSWFTNVTWDEIRKLPGTTYVQIPKRHQFAVQQAQHAILRYIAHCDTSTTECENGWTLLILSSWLLLGRPTGK